MEVFCGMAGGASFFVSGQACFLEGRETGFWFTGLMLRGSVPFVRIFCFER